MFNNQFKPDHFTSQQFTFYFILDSRKHEEIQEDKDEEDVYSNNAQRKEKEINQVTEILYSYCTQDWVKELNGTYHFKFLNIAPFLADAYNSVNCIFISLFIFGFRLEGQTDSFSRKSIFGQGVYYVRKRLP